MDYVVVDIETAGKGIRNNRITEICIVRMNEDKILDKFVSLVNPQVRIPNFITGLTGIDDDMVRTAPVFEEIAEKIVNITEDAVFVAHNVTFDYSVLRSEFRHLGYNFNRKKLCTVRLARKLVPGKLSYSLGRLCSTLSIPLIDRHRAEGDTDATVILFQRLMSLDENGIVFDSFLNSRKTGLAPNIDREIIGNLPQRPGVYYFKDPQGKIIYVGKAIRIRERVLSHFYDKKNKEYDLCQATATVDFLETGNELIALLLEADEIQNHYPKYNVAQKKLRAPYCIVHYTNRKGIIQFALDRKSASDLGAVTYYKREEAIVKLKQICEEFLLCPRFTGLQSSKESCSHYSIQDCNKVCEGKESVALYNVRAKRAILELHKNREHYAIVCKGRVEQEHGFVLVKDSLYQGYGFFDKDQSIQDLEDLEPFLIRKKNTYHTMRIITSYLNANPKSIKIMAPEAISI
ncbi:exonuclease domain-containing protein [Zobellia sp. 1_MG-2023]|uniref:exonuclease domain-containing protein n=1 Tax=Zobellia sp. 1_MG-2023 TaxID=3062626 RepID=UPI0026E1E74C|nr:exonuclease domain-containing protein [Zobellia sp. 1_MG-2023]MDO6818921.1 exonuclease domain-containing protein [Zobellia sp. 1_MG-2023]